MSEVLNIAAYKFVELSNLQELRSELQEAARGHNLLGTILLSPEGINLFLAGSDTGIRSLLEQIRAIPGLSDLEVKESRSARQPFDHLFVKVKREIIAFGVEGIAPARATSKRISPKELKRWLDEGRRVTLLDTRNNYEIEVGTFRNALAINVDDFRNFPNAAKELPEQLKNQPVVTFCTGGIRCEKAAPYLEQVGFADVYQLDGGILRYFEECGAAHFNGECFVFDQRVAVDPALEESTLRQCFACHSFLTPLEQQSPLYVKGLSCPHCADHP
jgi:predicted sulfurtransferase